MFPSVAATEATSEPGRDVRTGLDPASLMQAVCDYLYYFQGRHPATASRNDFYLATAYAVRDRLFQRGIQSLDALLHRPDGRTVAYLSAEFLMGPQLAANLVNLGIHDAMREALWRMDIRLEDLIEHEVEPGLGNGGLGRLAACYLDSLATLEIPAIGYGIRYEFGIFNQQIRDGWQVELTDKWLHLGYPWEVARPERAVAVRYGGYTEAYTDEDGRHRVRWIPAEVVKGVPHDTPILGYRVKTCNLLRLWRAEAVQTFDFEAFNIGDYARAVEDQVTSETISKVLYPNDASPQGKALRLKQQYFFVACAIEDMLRAHLRFGGTPSTFHKRWAAQLNDTHPTVAVPELMRLLLDDHGLEWDDAWEVTQKTFGYTNHTLLPEALETWPIDLFGALLPRHLEIVFEINRRLCDGIRRVYPGDEDRVRRMSLIEEQGRRSLRMANLACVGSHAINGVAALHTELLKSQVLSDWVAMFPERFCNITNGVTPRRFVVVANPGQSKLVSETIGDDWPIHLDALRRLETHADDPGFRARWRDTKHANKRQLAAVIKDRTGISVDPDSLFDIQVKRIHEYKRQHLNVLHILTLYRRLKLNPDLDIVPRTFVFGGKAAPGYHAAKLIIKLVGATGDLVNDDPDVRGRLKVVFFPNFSVKNGQAIYPAADLSEQISTAGQEASGTGNMKFALNGALTIGTLDGANIEIREEVGAENFFLFGLTADEVRSVKASGYWPRAIYEQNEELRAVIDLIASGALAGGDTTLFRSLVDGLLWHDPFMVLADYQSYVACQERVAALWRDPEAWSRMSILNVARMGKFSSDRSIRDYCERVWHVGPLGAPTEGAP
ncbi:glycogen phosphorylase [Rhodoplanes elegans]|uniref:Alpha-1,4 glucan phosphorylase n=1 Tax=Rhodoplanes elegans TaxID=29408 RepID=A0A327KQ38_9BRAD|nr:glycogen/starch/alpha-glucan phosphorylase [Rhodoplanes elegans]MBK5957117.1 glycogen phosphorylase [Rhodoplanes elegans]RAI39723.1 glycogen phosphorylase [Rhodoplanes elegans]